MDNKTLTDIIDQYISTIAHKIFKLNSELVENHLKHDQNINSLSSRLLVDTNELAKLLSVSKSTIVKLRKEGLPIIRIGDAVRFDIENVFQFIKEKNQTDE